jgi:hypothetical protein
MDISDPQLRERLLDDYHHAVERLHESRLAWEHWLTAPVFRHDERVDAAREQLRAAERDVEAVEQRINRAFGTVTEVRPTDA